MEGVPKGISLLHWPYLEPRPCIVTLGVKKNCGSGWQEERVSDKRADPAQHTWQVGHDSLSLGHRRRRSARGAGQQQRPGRTGGRQGERERGQRQGPRRRPGGEAAVLEHASAETAVDAAQDIGVGRARRRARCPAGKHSSCSPVTCRSLRVCIVSHSMPTAYRVDNISMRSSAPRGPPEACWHM